MSDLARRNTEAMISAAKRFSAEVCELREMIVAQNAKITTLAQELAALKQAQVMATVQAQLAEKGHGGTA